MRRQLRPLVRELARTHPELTNPEQLIRAGGVLVRGFPTTNPATLVEPGSVALRRDRPRVELRPGAELVALVKPQFELGLAAPPSSEAELGAALRRAAAGFEACGWQIVDSMLSPVHGARGARELLLVARRVESVN